MSDQDTDWLNAKITDEALAFMKAHIGIRRKVRPWNSLVTEDTIWHFAQGTGDDNPLWWDKAYAEKATGRMAAPPTYLYSAYSGGRYLDDKVPSGVDMFLPGVFGLWASEKWHWERPAVLGDKIVSYMELADAKLHETGKFGGRSVSHVERTTFHVGEDGPQIGEVRRTLKRIERAGARERNAFADWKPARYTAADREQFDKEYEAETAQRRGAEPRYIEDVKAGDSLGRLLKGPLTITNMVGWLLGWGSPMCQTNRIAHNFLKATPGMRYHNPETGIDDTLEGAHWDPYLAQMSGVPEGYDFGAQRISWLCHLLTDWGGDAAFVSDLDARILRPNFLGDTQRISGQVTTVQPGNNEGAALCELKAVNQDGLTTAVATARVVLPSRPR
jgi:acyl dehydratase